MLLVYVDDEVELGPMFIESFAIPNKVEIVFFSKPREALEFVKNNPVDALFLDYRMPGMNGDELAIACPHDIPKVLVTGELMPEIQQNLFIAITPKPYDFELVENLIQGFLRDRK